MLANKNKSRLFAINKPYGVISQFSGEDQASTLKSLFPLPGYYPAGRLDKDSEGLLLLTNDGKLQAKISDPKYHLAKTYWAQVEGAVKDKDLVELSKGLPLKDGLTKPAIGRIISSPDIWVRNPPIRFRQNIPTTWLEIIISEGKNRQVRRMTAYLGFPTLRLVRVKIGNWSVFDIPLGTYREVNINERSN